MRPTWRRVRCTVSARKPGKVSSPGGSPFFQEVLRCFAHRLPENGNDKNRSPARAAHARPSLLSSRLDKDLQTQSRPAVPFPKFLRRRANSAARDIAPCATPEENESCKRASSRLFPPSSSGLEQSERAGRAAPAFRCNRSSREDNVSRRRLPANRTG